MANKQLQGTRRQASSWFAGAVPARLNRSVRPYDTAFPAREIRNGI